MKRIKRIRWLLLGIAAASVIIYAAWPRPKLVWYTTPVMPAGRHNVRIKLLVPRGWKIDRARSTSLYPGDYASINPSGGRDWFVDVLRRVFRMRLEASPEILLTTEFDTSPKDPNGPITVESYGMTNRAFRVIFKPMYYCVYYTRSNKAEFDSTYR